MTLRISGQLPKADGVGKTLCRHRREKVVKNDGRNGVGRNAGEQGETRWQKDVGRDRYEGAGHQGVVESLIQGRFLRTARDHQERRIRGTHPVLKGSRKRRVRCSHGRDLGKYQLGAFRPKRANTLVSAELPSGGKLILEPPFQYEPYVPHPIVFGGRSPSVFESPIPFRQSLLFHGLEILELKNARRHCHLNR